MLKLNPNYISAYRLAVKSLDFLLFFTFTQSVDVKYMFLINVAEEKKGEYINISVICIYINGGYFI